MPDLLLELLSEEIPARMQENARNTLRDMVTKGLKEAGVTHGTATAYSTPRRLTLHIEGLPDRTPDLEDERKGPRTDAPEKALEGFLRSTGLTKDELDVRPDKKGDVYFAVIRKPGIPVSDALTALIPDVIRTFPWPKSMRWGSGDLRWVRPLTSILCLLDDKVVPVEIDDFTASNETRGHRMVDGTPFTVSSFTQYRDGLASRGVTLDAAARAATIHERATALCAQHGVTLLDDPALLTENAGLTEWPTPIIGEIEEQFRELPAEVLQTSMREHQKFFSAVDGAGQVTHFVAVANVEGADGGKTILHGNAKVLRARLADAKFFWENDLRAIQQHGFEGMAAPLADVTFHNQLGTTAERIDRIAQLAGQLAPITQADPAIADAAARAAKADLASEMVYEFPELQGLMGRYYAGAAGLDPRIAAACEDHYKPLGPSDTVPEEPVSVAVALAEKLDMLAGFWAIEEKPTGSKDPFALRRAALGVIRLIIENDLRFHLSDAFGVALTRHVYAIHQRDARSLGAPLFDAIEGLSGEGGMDEKRAVFEQLIGHFLSPESGLPQAVDPDFERSVRAMVIDLLGFVADRLKTVLRGDGVRHDLIDAVFALGGQDDLVLLVKRVRALQAFLATEDGTNLLAGYKRAANILAAEEKKGALDLSTAGDAEDTKEETVALASALGDASPRIDAALRAEDFEAAMRAMSALRGPIDAFFDNVIVNADDAGLRAVRLTLLATIRDVVERVADFSKIEG
jgi:glycyl-tRNA synthetase beta chain